MGGTRELSSCADVNGFASRRIVSDSFKELLSLSDESCLWNGLPSVEHSKQLGLPSFDEDVAEVALGKVLLQLHQNKVRFGNLVCSCCSKICEVFLWFQTCDCYLPALETAAQSSVWDVAPHQGKVDCSWSALTLA